MIVVLDAAAGRDERQRRRGSPGFFGVVIAAAIVTSFVYGGKTWCNFLCPVGLVEKIHTEPSRSSTGRPSELTSQCAPCVACKKHCPDIDLEQGYWKEANEQPRRVAYFAWPGIVVGFYTYYYLVAGDWSDYFTRRRGRTERDLPSMLCRTGVHVRAGDPADRRGAADADRVRRGQLRDLRDDRDADPRVAQASASSRSIRRTSRKSSSSRACATACSRSAGLSRSTRSIASPVSRRCSKLPQLGGHGLGPDRRVQLDGDVHAPARAPRGSVRPREVRAEDPEEVGVGRRAAVG